MSEIEVRNWHFLLFTLLRAVDAWGVKRGETDLNTQNYSIFNFPNFPEGNILKTFFDLDLDCMQWVYVAQPSGKGVEERARTRRNNYCTLQVA